MHWTYLSLNLGNDSLYYLFLIIQCWFKCEQRDDSNEPSSVKKYSQYRRHANDHCSWRIWLRSKQRFLESIVGLWTRLSNSCTATSSQRLNLIILLSKNKSKNVIKVSFLSSFSDFFNREARLAGFQEMCAKGNVSVISLSRKVYLLKLYKEGIMLVPVR